MFNRIPSDVSEIVVVYSRCIETYKEMKQIVKKFEDECVEERILDKLTMKTVNKHNIFYQLGDTYYRSYDKPNFIAHDCDVYYVYQWSDFSDRYTQNMFPVRISFEGRRIYKNRIICGHNSTYIYNFDGLLINECGYRYSRRHISKII